MGIFSQRQAHEINPGDPPAVDRGALTNPRVLPSISERITTLLKESEYFRGSGSYDGVAPVSGLSSLAVLRAMHSESLLVVRDPLIDPVLCSWLSARLPRARELLSETARAQYLLGEVRETFSPPFAFLGNPVRRSRFEQMTATDKSVPRLLGEIIQNRIGVCRHIAPLVQAAFEGAGLNSAILYGTLSRRDMDRPEEPAETTPHVWNVALLDGKAWAVDPMNQIFEPLGAVPARRLPCMELHLRFAKTPTVSRSEAGIFRSPICTVLQPSVSALSGPFYLSEELIPNLAEACARASRSFHGS